MLMIIRKKCGHWNCFSIASSTVWIFDGIKVHTLLQIVNANINLIDALIVICTLSFCYGFGPGKSCTFFPKLKFFGFSFSKIKNPQKHPSSNITKVDFVCAALDICSYTTDYFLLQD